MNIFHVIWHVYMSRKILCLMVKRTEQIQYLGEFPVLFQMSVMLGAMEYLLMSYTIAVNKTKWLMYKNELV